jgi:hypothetical protein
MRGGGRQRGGNPRREPLGQPHVLRAVRSTRIRVAKAQRAKHLMVGHDRDDEGGRRRQPALKRCRRAAAHAVVVSVNTGTERRFARAHNGRGGTGQIVTPDGTGADHRAHVPSEVTRTVARGDAAKRPRCGDVDEIEVGEARKRRARGATGASMGRRRRPPDCSTRI